MLILVRELSGHARELNSRVGLALTKEIKSLAAFEDAIVLLLSSLDFDKD